MDITHENESLGEISSRDDAARMRESLRGNEFRYGVLSNALDYALSGEEQHLVYLSPRDRRKAEALAEEIRRAID